MKLPEPECPYGYTEQQINDIFTPEEIEVLNKWMNGQTMMLCEGRAYSHDTKHWEPACGGIAHGPIIYTHDLKSFVSRLPLGSAPIYD